MKKRKIIVLAISVLTHCAACFSLAAQSVAADSLLAKALATDELLPVLIDSALKNSALLKRTEGNEAYAAANYHIGKNAIFNAVSLQSSYIYGTNYTAVNNQSVTSPVNNLTTAQTGFYNLGVGIQVPISYILNRKYIIRSGKSQIEMAAAEKENIALTVKQEVIRLYQDLKLSHRIMAVGIKNMQASKLNNTMAEKDFLNGQLTVDRLSVVAEIYSKTILEYETYVNRFQTSYMQLETFTGVNLSAVITRVK